ncbi:hypothetical protein C5Y96_07090 [Blastopirellula marina]|uniref:Uncharacterized protein n=1 Tax=Blastopirellula marina TaxID=124 RepID=A0A2S8FXY6_9BACT|nr:MULTISPECIES: hypothetical protein [Pirellulaceae]PQO36920.1 hypothetical protein C5Y96_07090 [Blastopirellula marina]RCS53635.1 hypothetical protein DTL36_07100 [Bremerella cremea]
MLRIADLHIPIESATLDLLLLGDEMIWGFTVIAGRFHQGDIDWPGVRVDSAGLFTTGSGTLNHWTDLTETSVTWGELEDNDVVPHAMIYVFEHELVQNGSAMVGVGGSAIHLELLGKCNIYFNERYDTDLDLSLKTELKLSPIMCGRDDERECWESLAQHLDPNLFNYAQDEYGVSMLVPKDERR